MPDEAHAQQLAEVFSRFGPAFMRWLRAGVGSEVEPRTR